VGFCGIFKYFLRSEYFLPQTESTPTHRQVTQTIKHMARDLIPRYVFTV
jgi:hypothetical protein